MVSGMIGRAEPPLPLSLQGRGGEERLVGQSGWCPRSGPNSFSCQMVTRRSGGRIAPIRDEGRHPCSYVSRRKIRGGRTQPCGVPLSKWWWKSDFRHLYFLQSSRPLFQLVGSSLGCGPRGPLFQIKAKHWCGTGEGGGGNLGRSCLWWQLLSCGSGSWLLNVTQWSSLNYLLAIFGYFERPPSHPLIYVSPLSCCSSLISLCC